MNFKKLFLIVGLLANVAFVAAQSSFEVKLYNSRPPYSNGDDRDTAKVRVYLPADREATGRAIIICPGGGYSSLSMTTEATIGANSSKIRHCCHCFKISFAKW